MKILFLTVFLSLLLASLFLLLFIRDRRRQDFGGIEQDALRPFEDETPQITLRR